MKSIYETPDVEFFWLYESDIITTSGGTDNGIDEDLGENEGEWM